MFVPGRVLSFMPINSSREHLLIGPILKPKLGLKRAGPAQPMSTPNLTMETKILFLEQNHFIFTPF